MGQDRQAKKQTNARLLVVDDEPSNVLMLEDMLQQAGYSNIQSTVSPFDALHLYRTFAPDIILLDMMMPGMNGLEFITQLRQNTGDLTDVPVLMLTADITPQTKRQALGAGVKDFLTKPFDVVELLLRISNLLETHFLYADMRWQNTMLEDRVRSRTGELETARGKILEYAVELEESQSETLERLALAGEHRDDDTGHHTFRVGTVTALLAAEIGFSKERCRTIQQAARLHDVGKIGISDLLLLKTGKLSDEEFDLMKTHTKIGAALFAGGKSELIQMAETIARSHHERWDGSGYMQHLQGEEIPVEARLLAVADVFDALTHDRPYKKAWPIDEAVAEIRRQAGRHFEPRIVEAFLGLSHKDLV